MAVPNGIVATAVHAQDGSKQAVSNNSNKGPSASPTDTLSVKRKRDDDSAPADRAISANGIALEPAALTKVDKNAIRDYLTILQK